MNTQSQLVGRSIDQYDLPKTLELAREASRLEASAYAHDQPEPTVAHAVKCRLEETLEFCHRMRAQRIGLAFCVGLRHEAATVSHLFEQHGFELCGVACKVGGVPKERLGLTDAEKVHVGEYETMCNPILQALLLNQADTDLNVMLGLCVGHDALFLQHASSPTTVLAVKDRVTGHNPMAALYTHRSYYRRLGVAPAPNEDQEQ